MEIGKCYVCKSFLGQKSSVIHEAEENDCYELCDACSNNLQGLLTKSHRDIIFNFINQPERSKREDLCCTDMKDLIEKYFPLHGDQCLVYKRFQDMYTEHKMRCSEHCGNTVRDK